MSKNINLITGIQGSGKGTFARILSEKHDIVWICTGDIFRWNIKNKTSIAKALKTINSGNMAPDEITNKVMMDRLDQHDWDYDLIIDGYPRNVSQANFLISKYEIRSVVNLLISDQLAFERIRHRSILNGKNARKDDIDESAIERRIELYHRETEPTLEIFKSMGVLHNIVNTGSIDSTYSQIKQILNII